MKKKQTRDSKQKDERERRLSREKWVHDQLRLVSQYKRVRSAHWYEAVTHQPAPGGTMKEKDTYTFQVERVRRVVEENWPGKIVEVDPSPLAIRFRVMEPAIGTELARVLEHWEPSEFADKFPTDKDLSKFIKTRSNGLL